MFKYWPKSGWDCLGYSEICLIGHKTNKNGLKPSKFILFTKNKNKK